MNAQSRLSLRTKLILGLFAVGLACVVGVTALGAAMGEPKIDVTFLRYETNENYVCAVMRVKNSGSAPAMILGYGRTNAALEYAYKDRSGVWQPRIRTCGTGLSYHMILPRQELKSLEYMSHKAEWRSGIRYREVSWVDRLPELIQRRVNYYPQTKWGTAWSRDFAVPPIVENEHGEESLVALE